MKFQTDKIHRLENKEPSIPYSTIRRLVDYIERVGATESGCFCFSCTKAQWEKIEPEKWSTKNGKLPKRIERVFYSERKLKLTSEQKEAIGNFARSAMAKREVYYFDFTTKYDWRSGDFGDSGSCFWTDRSLAREILESNTTYAIRFYHDDQGKEGFARAWIVFDEDNNPIVFNGYGLEAKEIATILATFLGLVPHSVRMDIPHDEDEIIYLNGDGYILLKPGEEAGKDVDIPLSVPYRCCRECGHWTHLDMLHKLGSERWTCTNCIVVCHMCSKRIVRGTFYIFGGPICHSCWDCYKKVANV